MKHWITMLLLICCLALLLGMVACAPTDDPVDDPTDDPVDDPSDDPTETPVPWDSGDGLQLFNEDGTFRYAVTRSELANAAVKAMGISMRRGLEAVLGYEIVLQDDWVDYSLSEEEVAAYYEILIGETKRPESKQVLESITEAYTYKIEVVGNKIVIVGADDKATAMAVQYFLDTYATPKAPIPTDLLYSGVYIPAPYEIVLEDHSTGTVTPRLVETKYPTEDVVIADIIVTEDGYAVSPDGIGNSTPGIQKALNDCAAKGGGTVYLPAGMYTVTGQIVIPPFVTLRGDWQDPDTGNEYGTILLVYSESEDNDGKGTVMLGGSGGVVGMTVYYPEQDIDAVKPYPFTFYTDGAGNNYMLSTVKNVTVLNGYRGIGACVAGGVHEQLTVENFKGTFLYSGTEVYNQADVGTWQDVTIANKYWKEAAVPGMLVVDGDKLDAYTKANAVGLKLGDLEWTEFESLKVSDCKIGIEIVQGKRIQFAGSLLDIEIRNCGIGLQVNDLDPRWGMVISRSVIEGDIINQTDGLVKLCDVEVGGDISGEVSEEYESDLGDYEIDYTRTYQKPAASLYVVEGLDKTGKTDATAVLQAVLNEAAATGGVVYVPAGMYRFDGKITVPAGVELRGASSVAQRDQGGNHNGTLFLCYYGDDEDYDAESDYAFITLNGDYAGLNGIRIIYPENSPYEDNLNTTYTVRGKGKGVYIVNASISASAYGVDFRDCDAHFIKKVTTCCYYNAFRLGGKGGSLSGCLQNGTVLARCNIPACVNWLSEGNVFTDLFNPILRLTAMYIIVDGAQEQQIYNTFCYGCATLVICNDSTALVANIGSDNIGDETAQLVMNSGEMVVVNSMRYNGHSFDHNGGDLELYNRLTINNKTEATYVESK